MVQLIVGNKGKGKTKELLDKVNAAVQTVSGNVVYLDKSTKNMFELNNKIRLIDVSDYLIESPEEFTGFIAGILSQDHDLEQMYVDGFMKIACLEDKDITATINKLEDISKKFNVTFVVSVALDEKDVPAALKENIIISL